MSHLPFYISILLTLQIQLREFDRVRTLYEKYIEVCLFHSLQTLVGTDGYTVRSDKLIRLDQIRRA